MHGHKRSEYKARMRDPKVAAGLQHKANQWFKLDQGLQGLQNQGLQEKDSTLELTANMLQVNPDPLYLWNRRRSMLLSDNTDTSALDYLKEELTLTQKCLERNPKAYGAWFHRKWCILQQQQSSNDVVNNNDDDDVLLKGEIALTTQFLNLDERNFHCWNYRRFIVGCLCNGGKDGEICVKQKVLFGSQVGAAPSTGVKHDDDDNITIVQSSTALLQSEFEFTTTKIQQNFSNGSAFHYRSKLLPLFVGTTATFSLDDELELAHNAMFTEPDDQTAWWYYDFLLEDYGNDMDLDVEKEMLEQLIEVEGGQSKWGLLGLYQVVSRMAGQESRQREILESLKMLDPDRSARYNDMLKSILMIE